MDDDKALKLLDHIGRELKLLWGQLEVWQALFDVEQEKRQTLIGTAPGFFVIVQVTLAESILMRIGRLMDPPQSCGEDNSSLRSLHQVLPNSPNGSLCEAIQALTDEWPIKKDTDTGEFARLKLLRKKWLAHNDWKQRQDQPAGTLGIPLSHEDFALAQRLAGRLWSIYREACQQLLGTDVLEPQPACLENRASMVLKRLCGSLYLDELLASLPDEARLTRLTELQQFERKHMGEDRVRHVFTRCTKGAS